ncbi:putative helicase senataxin [Frankliniella fusca]|uniref:Helicase senataxin n=1 Tax=Frankliniella fusca TaxID=407009 RepID=A0AAE1GP59_9NEOP|nr:putative helicase senataxin [Frankliniella fusca]KAK3918748.1 putative helicase senataxin [Frankliniella fusca]
MASPNLPVVSKGKGGRGIQSHRKCWAKSCSSDAIHNPYLNFMGQDAKRRPDRMHLNPKGMDVIEEALKTVPPFQPPTNN